MTPAELFGALFTYWIASDIVCLLVLRLFDPRDRERARDVFFLTRGVGPLAISCLLFHFLLLLPAQQPYVYVLLMVACSAVALFVGRSRLGQLAAIYRDVGQAVWRRLPRSGAPALLAALIAAIALFILVIGVTFPIVEGDGLGFAEEARLIHRDLSFENYPTVHADEQTGYHFDTFQIPCLQTLYVWFFLLTGTSDVDTLPRTVAPMYGLFCVMALCWFLYRRTRSVEAAMWGGLALIAAPLFTAESYYNTQDPHRLYSFFCALVWLDVVLESKRRVAIGLLGVFIGLAIYSHFAGLMLLPVILSLYVWFGRRQPRHALAAAVFIGLIALTVGGTHHYLRPAVVERIFLQFPLLQPLVAPPLASLGLDYVLPHKTMVVSPQAYDWLASRRGHEGWLAWLLFAKLQMFTGIEFFGAVSWLAAVGMILLARRSQKNRLDVILAFAAVVCTFFVLSDVRKMASSNPRYIGTILPIAAYFTALTIAAGMRYLRRRAPAPAWRMAAAVMIFLLVGPLALNVAVRGAKVGLNNSANVVELVRNASLSTIRGTGPKGRRTNWQRYFGIRQTIAYFFASDTDKLMHTHDTFAAINYMRTSTPKTSAALTFRVTRYFYYAQRRGIAYTDPRLEGLGRVKTPQRACRFLANLGVDHVLMDSYYETYPMYADTQLENLLSDPVLSTKVYVHGSAEVFQLHCSPRVRPANASPTTPAPMPFSRKRREIGG